MHVLHTQVSFVLESHDAQQVVRGDSAEGQTQRLNGIQGVGVARLLVHKVIDRRVELDDVVTVKCLVHVLELQVGVLLTEAQVYDFFILQKRELFQSLFEMLHFSEDLSQALVVVDVKLWIQSMIGFKSL